MTYPALAVSMTRSLGIALSTEDAQRLHERLQDIASQLVLQEREACARILDAMHMTEEGDYHWIPDGRGALMVGAEQIRNRGKA